jgi:hypothetical protein
MRVYIVSLGRVLLVSDVMVAVLIAAGKVAGNAVGDFMVKGGALMSGILAVVGITLVLFLEGEKKEKALLTMAAWLAVLIALSAPLFIPVFRTNVR